MLANGALLGRNGRVGIAVSNLQGVLTKHRRSQQGPGWHGWPWGREAVKDQRGTRNTPAPDACHASGQSKAPHGRAEKALPIWEQAQGAGPCIRDSEGTDGP